MNLLCVCGQPANPLPAVQNIVEEALMGRLDGDRIQKTVYSKMRGNVMAQKEEAGNTEKMQHALSEISIPIALGHQVTGLGFAYTEEEDQYILAVLGIYQHYQSSTVGAAEYIAQSLDRSRNAVQNRIRRQKMGAPAATGGFELSDDANSSSGEESGDVVILSTSSAGDKGEGLRRRLNGAGVNHVDDPLNGHPYTAEETTRICSMYLRYRQEGKKKRDCDAAIAARLGRSARSIKNKIQQLRRNEALPLWDQPQVGSTASEEDPRDVDRSSARDRDNDCRDSDSDSDGDTSSTTSQGSDHTSPSTLSAGAFTEALDALAVPDISNRTKVGIGFRYSHEEDTYILAVERLFRRAQREPAELKKYLAQTLERPRAGIENRLLILKGSKQQPRKDTSGDAEDEERNRAGSVVPHLGKRKRPAPSHGAERTSLPSAGSDHSQLDADQSETGGKEDLRRATKKRIPVAAKKAPTFTAAPRIQRLRFTEEEDTALRASFERLSPVADDTARKDLSRRLAVKLSRLPHVVRRRAQLLGCWDCSSGGGMATGASVEDRADVSRPIVAVSYNAGGFTPEEDAIIWDAYTQHRIKTASSAAAGGAGGRDGVLSYVSELAELLGRSYTQVQRRLDRLRAQDQATPRG
jgi:biotin operon repressor